MAELLRRSRRLARAAVALFPRDAAPPRTQDPRLSAVRVPRISNP